MIFEFQQIIRPFVKISGASTGSKECVCEAACVCDPFEGKGKGNLRGLDGLNTLFLLS